MVVPMFVSIAKRVLMALITLTYPVSPSRVSWLFAAA
jgi:hypothetical protein